MEWQGHVMARSGITGGSLIHPRARFLPWGLTARLSADCVTDKLLSVAAHSGPEQSEEQDPAGGRAYVCARVLENVCFCCMFACLYAYRPVKIPNTGRNVTGPPSETLTFSPRSSGPEAARGSS